MTLKSFTLLIALGPSLYADPSPPTLTPTPRAVSQPVPVNKVNDAALWVHPAEPEHGILFVSNELRGVELHDPDGSLQKLYDDDDFRPNNVDVLYEFAAPRDVTDDLLVAAGVTPAASGVKIFRIDPAKRRLTDVTANQLLKVFDGAPHAGLCTYHSRKTHRSFFFVTAKSGQIEQHELTSTPEGEIAAKLVRKLQVPSKTKFCVADDETGQVYFAEEKVGVWKFPAEPDAPAEGQLIIKANENGLTPDVVGLALYSAAGGKGYLIAVSQGPKGADGHSTLKFYNRAAPHEFVLTVDPALDRISGVAVTNRPMGKLFPQGMLAANDRLNPNASEDFKLFAWPDIATPGRLATDTGWSPRAPKR